MTPATAERKIPAYAAIPMALAYPAAWTFMTPGPSYEMEPDRSASLTTVVLRTTNVVTIAPDSAYWTDGLHLVAEDQRPESAR